MNFSKHIFLFILSVCATSIIHTNSATAQSYNIFNIVTTPVECGVGGTVSASVSVDASCSQGGFAPFCNIVLFGPSPDSNPFQAQNGASLFKNNLLPGSYFYRASGAGNCSGFTDYPFTIAQDGFGPNDIEVTHNPIDCSDDDFVTVQNNSSVAVDVAVLGGASLGSIAAGQSADYPNTSYDFTLTVSTPSCSSPVEYVGVGPIGSASFGTNAVVANVSTTNATNGLLNGSATITISNSGNFSVVWSTGQTAGGGAGTTSTINNLEPGTYSVEVTSGNGCTFSETFTISNEGGGTGIESLSSSIKAAKIVPNPVRGNSVMLDVDAMLDKDLSISIVNAMGQEVVSAQRFQITQGTNRLSINLNSSLANGFYSVKMMTDNKVGSLPMMYVQD